MAKYVFVALAIVIGMARADVADFYGNWENTGRDQSGVAHVVISPAGGNEVSVRVYGDCHPVECSWGLVDGRSYTADPRSGAVASVAAEFNFGFARRHIIFRNAAADRLSFEVLTDFSDGSEKHDFDTVGTLKRSTWAGPLGQNWERPGALGTGWGGGVHAGARHPPVETCTDVDPKTVRAVQRGSSWSLGAGIGAGATRQVARRAEDTIRHYGFDRLCRVAKMTYWRRAGGFPADRIGGADCIGFNPTTVHAARIGHSWKVVDGVQWIASSEDKAGADAVLALIRAHHLDAECFVGRPDPVMVYWLSY
jgi:hypothetical protein